MRRLMIVCAISLLISSGIVAFDCMQNKDEDKIYYIEEMQEKENGEYRYITTDGKVHFVMNNVKILYDCEESEICYLEVIGDKKIFHLKR